MKNNYLEDIFNKLEDLIFEVKEIDEQCQEKALSLIKLQEAQMWLEKLV